MCIRDSIIGGGMCFTFLLAQGKAVGTSLKEEDWVERAAAMIAKAEERGVQLLLPVDVVCADRFAEDAETLTVSVDGIPGDMTVSYTHLLSGQHREFVDELQAEMQEAAAELDFERAARIKARIDTINSLTDKQHAVSTRNLDADVVGLFLSLIHI